MVSRRHRLLAQWRDGWRRPFIIAVHMVMIALASHLALWLRFDGEIPAPQLATWQRILPVILLIRAAVFAVLRLYEDLWRYTSTWDLRNILIGVFSSSVVVFVVVRWGMGITTYPRSVFIIDAILLIVFMGGLRLIRRITAEFVRNREGKRVVIFGAGDAGEMIARDMRNKASYGYRPVGFIDDDPRKVGRRIHGLPVLGTRKNTDKLIALTQPDEVLIAMPSAPPRTIREIVQSLENYNVPIRTLPNLRDLIECRVEVGQIRSLVVDDLLARVPVGLDEEPLKQLIGGRRVMVTGAGGSIGSELCRQIAALRPASLLMFERYENSLHELRLELHDRGHTSGVCAIVGDVADPVSVTEALRQHRPDVIFHAAAHKHVPLMEENPCEAIKNNVRGTRILAEAAQQNGVERFILISTDKAVNPTSVMGASKRVAELIVNFQRHGDTSFSVVRFGNVLGSNGSVVPRFIDQIKRGGPVTITHPEIRRFFMLIPEAVQLVLHAATQGQNGAIYVLDMGEPVKLVDLARHLIHLSGRIPDDEIAIEFIGLRPGEKLFEELIGAREQALPSAVEKVLCVRSIEPAPPHLLLAVRRLEQFAAAGNVDRVRQELHTLVPEYIGVAPLEAQAPFAAVSHSSGRLLT